MSLDLSVVGGRAVHVLGYAFVFVKGRRIRYTALAEIAEALNWPNFCTEFAEVAGLRLRRRVF